MWKKMYKKAGTLLLLLTLTFGLSITALAETLPGRTAKATGAYVDPVTGEVEDAGGKENEALGQSMVTNVVDETALIEENPSGGYYVSLRFQLMDNLSDVRFSERKSGSDSWKQVESEKTASDGEQADFRFPMEAEDSTIRVECHVEAMGRDVIFFVTLSDFTEGNPGAFVQMDSKDAKTTVQAEQEDVLADATGLTTGGTASATLVTETENSETIEPQQLNLSAGVWWMLFVIVFCANILAGLVLFGIKTLLLKMLEREKRIERESEDEEEENENDLEFTELSESDWEDLKSEEDE